MKLVSTICLINALMLLASPHVAAQLEARADDGRIFILDPDGTYTEKKQNKPQSYIPVDFIELHMDAEKKVGLLVEIKAEVTFLGKDTIILTPAGRLSPSLTGVESSQITRETQVLLRNECFPECIGTVRGEIVRSYLEAQLAIHEVLR